MGEIFKKTKNNKGAGFSLKSLNCFFFFFDKMSYQTVLDQLSY